MIAMDTVLAALGFGLGLGASAGLAPGPLGALVIGETVRHGVGAGLRVAIAPLLTDLPIIALALALVQQAAGLPRLMAGIALAGAAYLAWLAFETWRATPAAAAASAPAGTARPLRRGALVNLLNPHPYLFWFSVGAPYLLATAAGGMAAPAAFLLGFYLALVGAKMLLALLTGRLRDALLGRPYRVVMRLLALLLAGFALRLAVSAAQLS